MKLWRQIVVVAVMLCGIIAAVPATAAAANKVPAPPTTSPILDQAHVLQNDTAVTLAQKITTYEKSTGNQIAVLTISNLNGEDIEGYSYRVATQWGVGNKKANNGVLVVVAVNDRRVRIEVGRGLEPTLTDLQAYRIIQDYMIPRFKTGDYSTGISVGVQKIIDVIGGERLSAAQPQMSQSDKAGNIFTMGAVAFAFVISYLGAYLGRTKSWWLGGVLGIIPGAVLLFFVSAIYASVFILAGGLTGLLLDFIASKNYRERKARGEDTTWWGSGGGFFGSSGGSGGGFGGFGGGSFGGGGSSGGW